MNTEAKWPPLECMVCQTGSRGAHDAHCRRVTRYVIVDDGDGHGYVIPATRQAEFHKIVEAIGLYWDRMDIGPAPEIPDWAVEIGGSPTLVEFEHYIIR